MWSSQYLIILKHGDTNSKTSSLFLFFISAVDVFVGADFEVKQYNDDTALVGAYIIKGHYA